MARTRRSALALGAAAVALGGFVVHAAAGDDLAKRVADDVSRPVRPAGVGGQPFWNGASWMFMYPPSFDFRKVPRAVKYRFVAVDDVHRCHTMEADEPTALLSPIWGEIPARGLVTVVCDGIDGEGQVCGRAGLRRFWKSAPFTPGGYPPAPRSYAEASARACDFMLALPNTRRLLEKGEPDPGYSLNCYPAKMCSGVVRTMLICARTRPARAKEAMAAARAAAEYLIGISQPADAPLAHFPPTYRGKKHAARSYAGQNMLVYPAHAAKAYLALSDATGDGKYSAAAEKIARTYIRLQGADGTWPLKLWEKDGSAVVPNRLMPVAVVELLEDLYARTGDNAFRDAADRAFKYVEKGPLSDWNWECQFEDGRPHAPYKSLTKHDACSAAIFILRRFPGDAGRLAQARELLRFAEDQFVYWERPCRPDGTGYRTEAVPAPKGRLEWNDDYANWCTPGVGEQFTWAMPIDASNAKLIRTYLAFYEAAGDPLDLAKARALGDTLVRVQKDDGSIRTQMLSRPDADNFWINCMGASIEALDLLSKLGGPREQYICYRSFRPQLERTKDFAEMGIPLRCFFAANTINSMGGPYCDYPPVWKGFKEYDWSALDAQVEDLLKASPNAEFLCMVDLNTPYWATHKFSLDSFTDITHAACDPEWIRRTKEWMLDFIAYAEGKWGSRIRAYVLSGGGTSEWYECERGRTSHNKNAAWAKWCKARGLDYGHSVPDHEKIFTAAFENLVYDPAAEQDKIDYWKFHNSVVADAILAFAASARAAIPAGKGIGVFFGYYYASGGKHCSFGHLDYERVFASPDIDFLIAPGSYSERWMGGGSGSQLVHSTARLHGKRLLHEIDFGPHTQRRWRAGEWKTFEDDMAGNTREAAFAIANGCSYWWFDMWGGRDGFYDDPAIRARIAKLAEITRRYSGELPHPADEVLLVADPESICHLNEKDPKEGAFGEYFRNELSKTGVPFDVCTLSDLETRDISRARVVVCPAAINITPEKKALLEKAVLRGGKTVVWCYAPGLSDGRSLDPARVKEYAGVPYATPGVSTTAMGGWTSVYAHDYRLYTVEALRGIIQAAGVRTKASKPCVVFANERFLAVHTKDGGEIEITLPRRFARVVDLLSGEVLAESSDRFACGFAAPDTRLFGLEQD